MNRWIAAMLALLLVVPVGTSWAETDPEAFLGTLPVVPGNGCPVDEGGREAFQMRVADFIKKLQGEIDFRERRIEAWKQRHGKGLVAAAADSPGAANLDPEEIEKMSDEESTRLAERLMQDKYGISIAEIEKLADMNESGALGWGQAVVAEQQAEAEMDPAKAEADQEKSRKLSAIQQEMMPLVQKQAASSRKYANMLMELEEDRAGLILKDKVVKLEEAVAELARNSAQCETLIKKERELHTARDMYCSHMAPKYLDILRRSLAALKEARPDSYKIDELQSLQMQTQFGVEPPPEQAGLTMLQGIMTYALNLGNAYQYDATGGPFDKECREGLGGLDGDRQCIAALAAR